MDQADHSIVTPQSIDAVVIAIIARALMVEQWRVVASARLVEDLGADSLNLLEIVLEVNEVFQVELEEEAVAQLREVADLCGLVRETQAALLP